MDDMYARARLLLDGLREIELIVAGLYRHFSHSFPSDRIFWETLAGDEENHAAWISDLKTTLLRNGWSFEVGTISLAALNTSRLGIIRQIDRLRKGELGRRNAFFIARDFERTMIENRYYELIRSDNKDYRAVQDKIRKETEAHLQKLENYILTLFPV
jgi:hypothetical protein